MKGHTTKPKPTAQTAREASTNSAFPAVSADPLAKLRRLLKLYEERVLILENNLALAKQGRASMRLLVAEREAVTQ